MEKDGHIRLLPLNVANKIAAGEVVERPASVVKELMENAIDAGASRVEVSVTAGGRKLVEVRDNGCGMNRDDALLSIERQATSKIRDVDDIERITTLGFRGEAIPSIASVSRFSLKTRTAEQDAGTELAVIGGAFQEVKDAGVPVGTTVSVRDLFFNVPARRKFLRAYQTEQAHIRSVFTLHALAHPEIGMSLTADGRLLVNLPPGATLEERVRDLFGADFLDGLKTVAFDSGGIHLTGYAGLPNVTRNDRSEQYVFVNRRPATAPVIAYALREAYPPMDMDRKPIVLLFIELPAADVDVNVHPTKREVRFNKPADVREAIILGLSRALGIERKPKPQPVPNPPRSVSFAGPSAPATWASDTPPPDLRNLIPNASAVPKHPEGPAFPYPAPPLPSLPKPLAPQQVPQAPTGEGLPLFTPPDDASPWRWCRVVGQVADRYILLETDSGYVTVDPQAAHERVLYEQLLNVKDTESFSQKLLLPESVCLPANDANRLRKYLDVIHSMGFGIEDFGDDHFLVEALPAVLGNVSCRELLADIAHDLENAGTKRGATKWREEIIAQAACRAVIGVSTKMDDDAAKKLVDELAATRMPYTCPRGRPTMIFTSYRELARKFGR
jgi:DNA mismatch repair protein MutL